jgi:FlaA1/EpsC-like NDP-sugar epimerase
MAQEPGDTAFVAVRFGNVLGSSGSVIPTFRRQIAAGGPVTVTHSEMTRFFMTIPEAAQLVVQAGGIGRGGEIFVLDMGEPVRIMDLAQDMIRLSGHEPGRDIEIRLVGIRPGEKLDEELFERWERVASTPGQKIMRATRPPIDAAWLEAELSALESLAADGDAAAIVERLAAMVKAPQRAPEPV